MTTNDSSRDEILEAARREPWRTHEQIANDVGRSRSWVSDVLADADDELKAIRRAFGSGVELEADSELVDELANAIGVAGDSNLPLAKWLVRNSRDDRIESVSIKFTPKNDE